MLGGVCCKLAFFVGRGCSLSLIVDAFRLSDDEGFRGALVRFYYLGVELISTSYMQSLKYHRRQWHVGDKGHL